MFKNAGDKLETLMLIVFVLMLIASFYSIAIGVLTIDLIWLIVGIVGIFASFVAVLPMMVFAQMAKNLEEMNHQIHDIQMQLLNWNNR